VTVVLYGVAHTDFGEAFLSSTTRKGDTREEENSATEAYSQAFRRACSQFGLGRYLYQLPKLWLPYDANTISLMPEGERIAWVEKLYTEAGWLQVPTHRSPHPAPPAQGHPQSPTANSSVQGAAPQTAQISTPSPSPAASPTAAPSSASPTASSMAAPSPNRPTSQPPAPSQQRQKAAAKSVERVDEQLLKYLRNALDAEQTRKACRYYHVNDLAGLTPQQALHLSDYIEHPHKNTSATGSRA
jgi:hypothetical protein